MVRRSPVQRSGRAVRRLPIQEQRGSRQVRDRMMPPPVGGWNARDALSNMKETDAVFLRNWFPQQSSVISRPGFSEHCDTGTGAAVEQLVQFEVGSVSKLLAFSDGGVYDVTTSTPSTIATGLSDSNWSYDYITGYVILANGADVIKSYDGSTWANPAFTGVTLTNLNHVSTYKSRLYFVEKNSQSMWYGGVGAVAGALTEFDFSTVAGIKGNLVITSHLKGDGGDGGQDDLFVAIFEGGDVLAYTGSNPSDPTDWALVGHYRIGRPLSRLSYARADDDIYIVTTRGYEKLGEVAQSGRSTPAKLLLSEKIQNEVSSRVKELGESIDWRILMYQAGQMLIVTVPTTQRRYHVRNINTGAWCEFLNFDANSWTLWEGDAYFGHSTDGKVYAFDDGSVDDDGVEIRCDAHPAWSYLGYGSLNKQVELIRPFLRGTYFPSLSIDAGADYETIGFSTFGNATSSGSATWDVATWDSASWSSETEPQSKFYSRNALGSVIGFRLTIDLNAGGGAIEWNNTQVLFTVGGYR